MPNDDELNGQTTIISKSIKDILEFTFNREMKMKCFELLQPSNRISSSQPSNRISTHTQDSGSSSRSQPCSISLAPQQASRSSASQYSIPYRDSNIGDDVDVSGSNDESSDLSTTSSEKTESDALLKSDHQIMAEFLQDIQMLENL
ncbi:hypothetical protein M8J76_016068 [Diaphorina citri]|nr:hypothetical protein M8J76_016068 [Diaphorina citri]